MSEPFDPYRKWLGIPPKDQPPHHYRLLGIAAFEDDPDVIENAATRQMAHLRTYQNSKHAAHSQRLLSEISSAKICLLTPDRKAAYDEKLRGQLAADGKLSSSQVVEPPPPHEESPEPEMPALRFGPRWRDDGLPEPSAVGPPPVPIPMFPPPVTAAPVVAVMPPLPAMAGPPVAPPPTVAAASAAAPLIRRSSSASALRSRKKQSALPIAITLVSLLVLAGAGGIALVLANKAKIEPTTTHPHPANPEVHHADAKSGEIKHDGKHKTKPEEAKKEEAKKTEEPPAAPAKKTKPEEEASSFPIGRDAKGEAAAPPAAAPPTSSAGSASTGPAPKDSQALRDALRQELYQAEQALARRDRPAFTEHFMRAEQLVASKELPETPKFKTEIDDLRALHKLTDQFWTTVRDNVQHKIKVGEKLGFHGRQLELLSHQAETVEYRFADATHKQTFQELPPQPALLLASKTLLQQPSHLVAAAAFLAVDAKANDEERKFGKQLFALARNLGSKDAAVAKALGLKNADESITIDQSLLPKP